MMKFLSILALTALALLPLWLYSVNSDIDFMTINTFRSKRDSIPVINIINKDYIIRVKKRAGDIKLDGLINEDDWRKGEIINLSHMVLPYDTGHATAKSEVMMTYDNKAFYLAFIFHDTVPGKRPVESMRRDFVFTNNDNFSIYIDPFNDQTTGYSFGINAAGAQRDGSISNGNVNNLMWDCKWQSVIKNFGDRWTGEVRIPFKSIRYKTGVDHWGVQFSRNDMKLNEKSAWAPVPRQFATATLAYAGQLLWETPPPRSGLRLSLIPYLYGRASQNFENGEDIQYKYDFGFDAKVGLSTSLNLDLTYNPDFSQAEVDDQVTNLDRFELYFPEKRQFFLENSDLFGNYGVQNIRPFFSRRIGLDAPVIAGARLSGKVGHDWRIGLMDMQTGNEGDLLERNFFVVSVQKKVFARSNVGAILVNKQQISAPLDWQDGNKYNRIVGLEYNLASRDNFVNSKFFAQKSFTPGKMTSEEYTQGIDFAYSRKSHLLEMEELYVGRDYNAEAGYVPRYDYLKVNPKATFNFFPKNGPLEYHGFSTEVVNFHSPGNMELIERQISANYFLQFNNRAHLVVINELNYVVLQKDYDPTNSGKYYLPAESSYKGYEFALSFTSDNSKLFKYLIHSGYGGYYNGERWFVEGNLNYRVQPYGYISLLYSYNNLMLPAPWNRSGLWFVGTKLDVTFTDKLFFSTYIQYNQQIDNININARFQWRYKPVSDFFIVYSDNYFPEIMTKKNRTLVLKVSYWFN
ncbi:MAG TPA: DUF5916 domain-containing protein [Prolixibacteraceae bacterium]|nr:DUF5916 domain-containing protein [Prolixibacteraceae bacterium]